jgi:phospholipid transport system transporter-binding protein
MVKLDADRLVVSGPVTMDSVPALLAAGAALLDRVRAVDLGAAAPLDSASVALVLAWQRAAASSGRTLVVENAPAAFENLARLYGVSRFVGPAGR